MIFFYLRIINSMRDDDGDACGLMMNNSNECNKCDDDDDDDDDVCLWWIYQ